MKKSLLPLILIILLMVALLSACGEKAGDTNTETAAQTEEQGGNSHDQVNPNAWVGTVAETMDGGGYTYVNLDTGSEKFWVAGPQTKVEVGQEVIMGKGMAMTNFHSKALERTFDVIYFVGAIEDTEHTHPEDFAKPEGEAKVASPHGGGMAGGMGGMGGNSGHSTVEMAGVTDVEKAAGGYTVEEIFTESAKLGGQPVKVRGQVVKFTANIMGTNWAHIQDGTGAGPTGDLTVTTSDVVAVGDIVVVEGSLTLNKDFGAGYQYSAIIEGAKLTKE